MEKLPDHMLNTNEPSCHTHSYNYTIASPSRMQLLYEANLVISINNKNELHIVKNRWGENGQINLNEAIEIISDMLCKHKYDGRMNMFQEVKKQELIKSLKEIMKD